jgi:hypothetical protein
MKRGSLKVEVEDDHIVVVMEGSSLPVRVGHVDHVRGCDKPR